MINNPIHFNKILLFGLSNPTDEYKNTRHNTGRMFVEYKKKEEFKPNIVEQKLKEVKLFKIKNYIYGIGENFMNSSGKSVKEAVKALNIDISKSLILVHDDLDLKLGEYKFQFAKSPKLHNGVKSVEDHLGTKDFWRLRIGIDNRNDFKSEGTDYVLSNFKKSEISILNSLFENIQLPDLFKIMSSAG